MGSTPFTDPDTVVDLYADAGRNRQRTNALPTMTSGENATSTIIDLAGSRATETPSFVRDRL
ncbi:hypothetical protein [Nocardia asteroides]|uniref:hypothetical protein n=1 Tax=Nocardia asteroides TaxID=1824 RepID=UPI0034284EE0